MATSFQPDMSVAACHSEGPGRHALAAAGRVRSQRRSSDWATGVTLIELLVVMAVVAMMITLLLPAVQSARSMARRLQCQNNLRQIAIGLNGFHAAHGSFPPGGIEWRPPGNMTNRQLAWSAFLLPFIEEQPLYESLDLDTPFDSRENAHAAAAVLAVYVCPDSIGGTRLVEGRGPCDYGGIYGERITSPNKPPKGTMLYDQAIAIRHIEDGTSNTLIVAEDSQFVDGQWINGRNVFDQAFAINAAPVWENDIRSEHAGGAQAARADGSVTFLTESTDLQVLAALCTRAGHEAPFGIPTSDSQ